MTIVERIEAQLAYAAEEFRDTAWEGCAELDCVEGCSLNPSHARCVRFEQAFRGWLIENGSELAEYAVFGGAA